MYLARFHGRYHTRDDEYHIIDDVFNFFVFSPSQVFALMLSISRARTWRMKSGLYLPRQHRSLGSEIRFLKR